MYNLFYFCFHTYFTEYVRTCQCRIPPRFQKKNANTTGETPVAPAENDHGSCHSSFSLKKREVETGSASSVVGGTGKDEPSGIASVDVDKSSSVGAW